MYVIVDCGVEIVGIIKLVITNSDGFFCKGIEKRVFPLVCFTYFELDKVFNCCSDVIRQ